MKMEYIFTDASGRKLRAVLNIGDKREIAFTLATRARRQGRKSVKALDGQITLTLEEVA
jgi:hypothetical protein